MSFEVSNVTLIALSVKHKQYRKRLVMNLFLKRVTEKATLPTVI